MTRPLFRSTIVLLVAFVLLIVIVNVVGNMFEIQVRPKSPESKSRTEEASTPRIQKSPPQAAARDAVIGVPPIPGLPALSQIVSPQRPSPEAYLSLYGSLMTDIGISDHLKEQAVDVLKAFDVEMKQGMEDVMKGKTTPSLEVFKDMKARRDQKLREILGDSQYQAYTDNVDTIPERAAISSVQSRLQRAGMELSKDQSDKLFQAMVDGARSQNPTAEAGADFEPKGRAGASDNRFRKASGALREASSELSEAQKAEINRFIEDTNQKRARSKR